MVALAPARGWDVFVLAGQSNAGPSGTTSELTAEQAALKLDTRWWLRYEQPLATVLSTTLGWSFSRPVGATFGNELSFADGLRGSRNVAIVKFAVSGSGLATQWLPGSSPDDLYALMKAQVDTAVALLPSYAIRGFYWCQGENDANSEANADAYDTNLATFMAQFRSDYGANLPIVLNRLHVNSDEPFVANLRASQDAFVAGDAHAAIFSVDDQALKADNVHFPTATQLVAGARAATAMLGLL